MDRDESSCRSQFGTTFLTAVSVACMVCALAVGSSADKGHVMLEFGDMGAAFYSHLSALVCACLHQLD